MTALEVGLMMKEFEATSIRGCGSIQSHEAMMADCDTKIVDRDKFFKCIKFQMNL